MGTTRNVLIVTQDPRNYGGVFSMVRVIYEYLNSLPGFSAQLAYWAKYNEHPHLNRPSWSLVPRLIRGNGWRVGTAVERFEGMAGCAVGAYLPELPPLRYQPNRAWKDLAEKHAILQVVSGSAIAGYPLTGLGKKYAAWVATPFRDDREERLKYMSAHRWLAEQVSTPWLARQERTVLRGAAALLAISEYTAEAFHEQHGVPRERIRVLPVPVDTERFRPPGERARDLGVRLLYVGRLNDPRKRLRFLLDALRQVVTLLEMRVSLRLVGEDPSPELRRQVSKRGLDAYVEFCGRADATSLARQYREADMFVLGSTQEGLGLVVLEAMASGLPVVATRCGGPEMLIRDGYNGFLVGLYDAQAMADRIARLAADAETRALMGHRSRQLVEAQYSLQRLLPVFLDVYREVYPHLFAGQRPAESVAVQGVAG